MTTTVIPSPQGDNPKEEMNTTITTLEDIKVTELSEEQIILNALKVMVPNRGCVELRVLRKNAGPISGFYDKDHLEQMAKDAFIIKNKYNPTGIYFTINTIDPLLIARRENKYETSGLSKTLADDVNIINWDYLYVDLDPVRPTNISSTKEELNAAILKGDDVVGYLAEMGFCEPLSAISGNGYHLHYKINLPRSPENDLIVKTILYALDAKFSDKAPEEGKPETGIRIGIDTVNFNPSRICKLYGTWANKGDNTKERPHRQSKILSIPEKFDVTPIDVLKSFCFENPLSEADSVPIVGKTRVKKERKDPKDVTSRHPEFLTICGKLVRAGACDESIITDCRKVNAGFEFPKNETDFMIDVAGCIKHCRKEQALQAARVLEFGKRERIFVGNGYTIFKAAERAMSGILTKNVPEPITYVRATGIVDVIIDDKRNVPIIRQLKEDALSAKLNPLCEFYYTVKGEDKEPKDVETRPPMDIVKYVIHTQDLWKKLPLLNGVTSCPIISLKDGKIQEIPGYDKNLGVLYVAGVNGTPKLTVPEKPTKEDIVSSVAVLNDLLVDFPFVEAADRANTIALLISAVLKTPMNDVVYPMAIINKPIQGAGASKITRYCNIIRNGSEPDMIPLPKTEEECEKKMFASAIEGADLIAYDNLVGPLYFATLASQITKNTYSGRILGKTENRTIPFAPIWIGNGVNVVANGDLPRRCYFINIDPKDDRPWLKTEWTHNDLDAYVRDNRSELLSAILTLVRFWVQAGKPKPDADVPMIGGFEDWCNTIGGILSSTEYAKTFLGNLIKGYENCDSDLDQWTEFIHHWYKGWGTNAIKASAIVSEIEIKGSEISYILPDKIAHSQAKGTNLPMAVGHALKSIKGRRFKLFVMREAKLTAIYLTVGSIEEEGIKRWFLTESKEVAAKKAE
jgi:hypothetical protein